MNIQMKRSQKTIVGFLRLGAFYDFDLDDDDQKKVYDRLIDREFATEVTTKDIKSLKAKAEKVGASTDLGKAEAEQAAGVKSDLLAGIGKLSAAVDKSLEDLLKKLDAENDTAKKTVLAGKVEAKRSELEILHAEFIAAGGDVGGPDK